MTFLKQAALAAAAAATLLAAGAANAATWAWSYTGPGVTAAGTLTTAGNALSPEAILSITGTRNGATILGLVPLGIDPNYEYDNEFTIGNPHFSEPGMLFDLGGGLDSSHVNLYYDLTTNNYVDLRINDVTGAVIDTNVTFNVSAVPEAATYAYMALGLAGLGIAARRRKSA